MESGTKRFKIPDRCRVAVHAGGEFLVYGIRSGKRVALLGPHHVGDRTFGRDLRDPGFSHIEVEAGSETPWTVELVEKSDGKEYLDRTPVAIPVNAGPPSLREQVRELVAQEISRAAEQQGWESFREANDFEVDEDGDSHWVSPFEVLEMDDDYLSDGEDESPETPLEGLPPEPGSDGAPGEPSGAPGAPPEADPPSGSPGA